MGESSTSVRIPEWGNDDLALVCGLSNAGGGTILVEADDKTASFGFRKMRRHFESIPALVQSRLGISCYTEPVMEGSRMCLHITVPPADHPLSFEGEFYLYSDSRLEKVDGATLERIMAADEERAWEQRASIRASTSRALDEEVDRYKEAAAKEDMPDAEHAALEYPSLAELGLKDAQTSFLTNAGIVLLTEHPETLVPGAFIRIAKVNDANNRPESTEDITGPLIEQLEDALDAIFGKFLPEVSASSTAPIVLPPQGAVREALVNALAHKDYESGIPIQVSVYGDRLSIFNMGRPPATWTLESMYRVHPSRPNNPIMSEAMRKAGMMHGWGSGFSSMDAECLEGRSLAPAYDLGADDITVTFPLTKALSVRLRKDAADSGSAAKGGAEGPGRTEAASTGSQGIPGPGRPQGQRTTFAERSIAASLGLDLTGTDEYILKVLQTNGRVTAPRIASVLEISESTVRRSFRRLKEHGLIERIGSDKAGYWKVNL